MWVSLDVFVEYIHYICHVCHHVCIVQWISTCVYHILDLVRNKTVLTSHAADVYVDGATTRTVIIVL